jgi:hypothetical protein
MSMRMRQSLAQLEEAFAEEIQLERSRRARLRQHATHRSRQRRVEREKARGSVRFGMLVLSIIATAVFVTVAMFETLYHLLG